MLTIYNDMKQQLQSIQNKLVIIQVCISSVLHLLDINIDTTFQWNVDQFLIELPHIPFTYKPHSLTGKFRCMYIDIVNLG